MARNRKRTRDRRPRRPDGTSALATSNGEVEAPPPLEHASSEADLAEAQLALGRPELIDVPDDEELEAAAEAAGEGGGRGAGRLSVGAGAEGGGPGGGELAIPAERAPAAREPLGSRLANFLRGSWRELQRVQWPDRRQVFQATGVVIGFVIVAGAFLGLSDLVSQKLVNLILK